MMKAFTAMLLLCSATVFAQETVKINYEEKHTVPHANINARHDSLKFVYLGAPTRPVKEFTAVVTRFSLPKEPTVTQSCAETRSYKPGRYQVVVNTLPKERRDLEIGAHNEAVVLLQPGFAKFTCPLATTISLYAKDGKQYTVFHTLKANGPESKRLQLQPGIYQAHYIDATGKSKSVPFIIKPAQQTEVVMK